MTLLKVGRFFQLLNWFNFYSHVNDCMVLELVCFSYFGVLYCIAVTYITAAAAAVICRQT
jgi:hypothetical protein